MQRVYRRLCNVCREQLDVDGQLWNVRGTSVEHCGCVWNTKVCVITCKHETMLICNSLELIQMTLVMKDIHIVVVCGTCVEPSVEHCGMCVEH